MCVSAKLSWAGENCPTIARRQECDLIKLGIDRTNNNKCPPSGAILRDPIMNLFGSLKKTIFSFGLALALVFALLFYEEDRLKELFQIAKPDHLSVLYLKLLLNIKPDDTEFARGTCTALHQPG